MEWRIQHPMSDCSNDWCSWEQTPVQIHFVLQTLLQMVNKVELGFNMIRAATLVSIQWEENPARTQGRIQSKLLWPTRRESSLQADFILPTVTGIVLRHDTLWMVVPVSPQARNPDQVFFLWMVNWMMLGFNNALSDGSSTRTSVNLPHREIFFPQSKRAFTVFHNLRLAYSL